MESGGLVSFIFFILNIKYYHRIRPWLWFFGCFLLCDGKRLPPGFSFTGINNIHTLGCKTLKDFFFKDPAQHFQKNIPNFNKDRFLKIPPNRDIDPSFFFSLGNYDILSESSPELKLFANKTILGRVDNSLCCVDTFKRGTALDDELCGKKWQNDCVCPCTEIQRNVKLSES